MNEVLNITRTDNLVTVVYRMQNGEELHRVSFPANESTIQIALSAITRQLGTPVTAAATPEIFVNNLQKATGETKDVGG